MHARTRIETRLITDPQELRAQLDSARRAGSTIGVVPTMGALHEGHLSLVDAARQECDLCVVTVFVNPTQFGPNEDFSRYPRNLSADMQLVAGRGADLVFAPETEAIYPRGHATRIEVAGPALPLEGEFRPGHFSGVATVVLKLLNLVGPDRAYFGRKDYQQCMVVRRMVRDLNVPVEIVVCPIVREADGLAMSSRNVYLSASERVRALSLSRGLSAASKLFGSGTRAADKLLAAIRGELLAADAQIDYVAIADPETLAPVAQAQPGTVALIAARIGNTRLIDNEILE